MEEVGWNVIEAEGLMILFEVAFFIVIATPCKRKMSVLFVRSQPNACWQKEKAKLSIFDCRVPKQNCVPSPKKNFSDGIAGRVPCTPCTVQCAVR